MRPDCRTLGGIRFPYFLLFKIVYCIPYLLISSWYTSIIAVLSTAVLAFMLIRMSKAKGSVPVINAEFDDMRLCTFVRHAIVNCSLIALHIWSPVIASLACLAFMMIPGEFWLESPVLMLIFSKPMYRAVIRGVSVIVIGQASLMYTQLAGSVFVGRT